MNRTISRVAAATVTAAAIVGGTIAVSAATDTADRPPSCVEAMGLADAVASQGRLVADLQAQAATSRGDQARIAEQGAANALDAYGWTVDAYRDAVAVCRAG